MTDDLKNLFGELSLRIRLFMETMGRGVDDEQLSDRDLNFMAYLNEKGRPGFSEISAFFNKVSPSTVSNTLKKLHVQGLVARHEDPNNLKTKSFSLTERGRKALTPIKQTQAELLNILIDALLLTPEEAQTSKNIIQRAIENFDFWLGLSDMTGSGADKGFNAKAVTKNRGRLKSARELPVVP